MLSATIRRINGRGKVNTSRRRRNGVRVFLLASQTPHFSLSPFPHCYAACSTVASNYFSTSSAGEKRWRRRRRRVWMWRRRTRWRSRSPSFSFSRLLSHLAASLSFIKHLDVVFSPPPVHHFPRFLVFLSYSPSFLSDLYLTHVTTH